MGGIDEVESYLQYRSFDCSLNNVAGTQVNGGKTSASNTNIALLKVKQVSINRTKDKVTLMN